MCIASLQTCKVYKQMDRYSAANKTQVSFGGINAERRLSVTNLSSENNLPTFRLNASVVIKVKVSTFIAGAFSQNVGKLFSKLKLVTDNLSIYAAAN